MKSDIAKYELIDLYLEGKLEPEEMIAFKQKMQSDPVFAEEVEAQHAANEIIIGDRLHQVKEMMEGDFRNGKVRASGSNPGWWIGVAFVLALTSVIFLNRGSMENANRTVTDKTQAPYKSAGHETPEKGTGVEVESRDEIATGKKGLKEQALRANKEPSSGQAENSGPERTENHDKRLEDQKLQEKSLAAPMKKDSGAVKQERESSLRREENCASLSAEVSFNVTDACNGKGDGKLILTEVKANGAKAPLRFALLHEGQEAQVQHAHFQESYVFEGLLPGRYMLWVQEAGGCKIRVSRPAIVHETLCALPPSSFTPSYNEVFHFPVDGTTEGSIVIKDKGGNTVYQTEIRGGQPAEWDGTNIHGGICSPGVYFYILEDKKGKKIPGQVVIY